MAVKTREISVGAGQVQCGKGINVIWVDAGYARADITGRDGTSSGKADDA
jgi:hypothetical protein